MSILNDECLTLKLIYRTGVSNDASNGKKFHFGLSDTNFKERRRKHTRDFRTEKYDNSTDLAKYIQQLKTATSISLSNTQ